jgi:heme exporter protein A
MSLSLDYLSCLRNQRVLFPPLSLTVASGELLVVQGANGSGKSTLLRTLAGLRPLDSGEVRWQGLSIQNPDAHWQQQVLWLGHQNPFRSEWSVWHNLSLLAALRPQSKLTVDAALKRVGLHKQAHQPVSALSAGMQRRLALASLLLADATVWLLDEPQTSLDAQGVALFESLLAGFLQQGGCAVVASHLPLALSARIVNLAAV